MGTSLEPAAARSMFELWRRFAANHPRDEPHAYLSLLVNHPDHRGQGIGQRLLAEDLARFDADGVPAYLESTNPGNDHRYERAGFERIGGFQAVLDDAPISTMWRPSPGSSRGQVDFRMGKRPMYRTQPRGPSRPSRSIRTRSRRSAGRLSSHPTHGVFVRLDRSTLSHAGRPPVLRRLRRCRDRPAARRSRPAQHRARP